MKRAALHGPPRIGPTRVPAAMYGFGGLVVLVCGAWAAWPVERMTFPTTAAAPPLAADGSLAAIDTDAFDAPIWVAAPPPPPTPEPSAAPTPPRLRLVAILHDGERPIAALYDPDADRLLFASAGDAVADLTIDAISGRVVTFRDGRGALSLPVWDGGGP